MIRIFLQTNFLPFSVLKGTQYFLIQSMGKKLISPLVIFWNQMLIFPFLTTLTSLAIKSLAFLIEKNWKVISKETFPIEFNIFVLKLFLEIFLHETKKVVEALIKKVIWSSGALVENARLFHIKGNGS